MALCRSSPRVPPPKSYDAAIASTATSPGSGIQFKASSDITGSFVAITCSADSSMALTCSFGAKEVLHNCSGYPKLTTASDTTCSAPSITAVDAY
ncbi:hypothetical protein JCM24511_05391 [Saitozyma sp. JCM 24511]|nr:hypothetical protein JCM24511_05391 [Saitozyma sp. JCM 24511]